MSNNIELGQMAFGNPWGEYECPAWMNALVKGLFDEIKRVYWNRNQKQWDGSSDPGISGIEYRPYYWGDDEAEQAKPNFKHGDVEVRWYKYPMRGSSLNVPAEPVAMVAWFESALKAIGAADALPK